MPGPGGLPTQLPNEIDEGFPLTRPDWDYETAPGRESLQIYRQALLAGLKGAGKRPTNLAKVRTIIQERDESPAAFMERLLEEFRMYSPFDPEALEHKATVVMAFIDQAASDIKGKLQRLDGIQTYGLQELVREAEKVYNKRETPEEREARLAKEQEEREDRRDRKRDKHLTKILAAVVRKKGPGREGKKRRRPKVEKDQCAYCKEQGTRGGVKDKRGRGQLPEERQAESAAPGPGAEPEPAGREAAPPRARLRPQPRQHGRPDRTGRDPEPGQG